MRPTASETALLLVIPFLYPGFIRLYGMTNHTELNGSAQRLLLFLI